MKKVEEEKVKELTQKILNAVKENFEGMNYPEVIKESDFYDEDAHSLEGFYGSIEYDIKKILFEGFYGTIEYDIKKILRGKK